MKKLMLLLIAASVLVISSPETSKAQSSATVDPRVITSTLDAGSSDSYPIKITSSLPGTQNYEVSFVDFNPNTDGSPQILSSGEPNLAFGLKSYLSGYSSITLTANVETIYDVTVDIPKSADSRTRYGLVLFKPIDAPAPASTIGVIVIITTGEEVYDVNISSLMTAKDEDAVSPGGTLFRAEIENNSLFYIKPTITLELINRKADTTTKLSSLSDGGILPKSTRVYEFAWDEVFLSGDVYSLSPNVALTNGVRFFSTAEYLNSLSENSSDSSRQIPSEEFVLSATQREDSSEGQQNNSESSTLIIAVVGGVILLAILAGLVMHKKFKATSTPGVDQSSMAHQNPVTSIAQQTETNSFQISPSQPAIPVLPNGTQIPPQSFPQQITPQPQPTVSIQNNNQPQPPQANNDPNSPNSSLT